MFAQILAGMIRFTDDRFRCVIRVYTFYCRTTGGLIVYAGAQICTPVEFSDEESRIIYVGRIDNFLSIMCAHRIFAARNL